MNKNETVENIPEKKVLTLRDIVIFPNGDLNILFTDGSETVIQTGIDVTALTHAQATVTFLFAGVCHHHEKRIQALEQQIQALTDRLK